MSYLPPSDENKSLFIDESTVGSHSFLTSDLLASSEWQRTNPLTHEGLVCRLELMKDYGLPPMRVISAKTLDKLRRIPRSTDTDEGGKRYTEDALDVIKQLASSRAGDPNAIILFFSHRWLRPNYCEEEGRDLPWGTIDRRDATDKGYVVGYPDSSDNEKATALVDYARWFEANRRNFNIEFRRDDHAEIYFWIDFCCVDQTNPVPDMKALPVYAAVSTGIVSYFSQGYESRAWCQVERMLANAFMTTGDQMFVLPQRFRYDEDQQGIDEPPVLKKVNVPDPSHGNLTNSNDLDIVLTLREVASRSRMFSCWRTCVNVTMSRPIICFIFNICFLFQCCGVLAVLDSRSTKPGKGRVRAVIPRPYEHEISNPLQLSPLHKHLKPR